MNTFHVGTLSLFIRPDHSIDQALFSSHLSYLILHFMINM